MFSNETDDEGKLIRSTKEGKVYVGSSTLQDVERAEALKQGLGESLKEFVSETSPSEMKTLEFRYKIGDYLKKTMAEANIPTVMRKDLWSEIDEIADPGHLITKPAGKSSSNQGNSRHPFFETCYLIATYFDEKTALKFTWHQYNDLFGRPIVFQYPVLFGWFAENVHDLTGHELREVLKIATAFGKTHDFDCFEKEELYEKMDLFLEIERQWWNGLDKYFKGEEKNMSEARRKQKTKYKGKYIEECLDSTRFKKRTEWAEVCDASFYNTYVDVGLPPQ